MVNIEGTALVTPKASEDLLSVMKMIKPIDGRLGDSKTMTILDGQDNVILSTYNRGDDYWTSKIMSGPSKVILVLEKQIPNESQTLIHLDQQPHYRQRNE
jgi:hypothetical protein